jgi:gliding motility-associated-like protein
MHYISNAKSAVMKFTFLILLLFVASHMPAQLVNGSFEALSSMPNGLGQWQRATGWNNAGSSISSPDLLHYDAIDACDLPETSMGFVQSFDGDAVMGVAVCQRATSNRREYIGTQLSSPLQVGKPYAIGFRMTNGTHTSTAQSGLAVDKIGLLFSLDAPLQSNDQPIMNTPQLKIESVVYSEEWQTYIFTFIPELPYRYMTFGLFGDDDDKNIQVRRGSDPAVAYYFVDYFTIDPLFDTSHEFVDIKDTPGTRPPFTYVPAEGEREFFVPNTFTPNADGNNDVFLPVSQTISDWTFEIFSNWGDRVYVGDHYSTGWDGSWNDANCPAGSYVWQISYMITEANRKPRREEIRGMFHLVR